MPHNTSNTMSHLLFPFLFVCLYGSGFVGAKLGLPDSTPLSFLTLRFVLAGMILLAIALLLKRKTITLRSFFHICVAGVLTVATFSIGVFVSIDMGLSPALSAIIIALQPILVSVLAKYTVHEPINKQQVLGLFLGLLGVIFVVSHNIDFNNVAIISVFMSIIGLLGLTFGNIYQKKYCANMDVFLGGSIQSLSSGILCLILLFLFEEYFIVFSSDFIIALSYMTFGVSIGALSLLYIMIERSEVSKVATLFYLVPVSAAFSGYLLFDEQFDSFSVIGVGVVALGVYLSNKPS